MAIRDELLDELLGNARTQEDLFARHRVNGSINELLVLIRWSSLKIEGMLQYLTALCNEILLCDQPLLRR